MNVDEIIVALQEAKEHCVDGKQLPKITANIVFDGEIYPTFLAIDKIEYDYNVCITLSEL